MARVESRLDEQGGPPALNEKISALEHQFGSLRERMAHLEGLLEEGCARSSPAALSGNRQEKAP